MLVFAARLSYAQIRSTPCEVSFPSIPLRALSRRRSPETHPIPADNSILGARWPAPAPPPSPGRFPYPHCSPVLQSPPHTQTLAPPAVRRPGRPRAAAAPPRPRTTAWMANLFKGLVRLQVVRRAARLRHKRQRRAASGQSAACRWVGRWGRCRVLLWPLRVIWNPSPPPSLDPVVPPPTPMQQEAVADRLLHGATICPTRAHPPW
jgi:hypothetical protein